MFTLSCHCHVSLGGSSPIYLQKGEVQVVDGPTSYAPGYVKKYCMLAATGEGGVDTCQVSCLLICIRYDLDALSQQGRVSC